MCAWMSSLGKLGGGFWRLLEDAGPKGVRDSWEDAALGPWEPSRPLFHASDPVPCHQGPAAHPGKAARQRVVGLCRVCHGLPLRNQTGQLALPPPLAPANSGSQPWLATYTAPVASPSGRGRAVGLRLGQGVQGVAGMLLPSLSFSFLLPVFATTLAPQANHLAFPGLICSHASWGSGPPLCGLFTDVLLGWHLTTQSHHFPKAALGVPVVTGGVGSDWAEPLSPEGK